MRVTLFRRSNRSQPQMETCDESSKRLKFRTKTKTVRPKFLTSARMKLCSKEETTKRVVTKSAID